MFHLNPPINDLIYRLPEQDGTYTYWYYNGGGSDNPDVQITYDEWNKATNNGSNYKSPSSDAEYKLLRSKYPIKHVAVKPNDVMAVKPTTINTTSGAGVPGGFTASSTKTPTTESAGLENSLASIISIIATLAAAALAVKSGLMPPIPGLSSATSKLTSLKSTYQNKLTAAKNAPDFTKKYVLPSPPKIPSTPNFKSLGIDIPTVPKVPSINVPTSTISKASS